MKYTLIFAPVIALATPALAEEVGVGVGLDHVTRPPRRDLSSSWLDQIGLPI